VTLSVYVAKVTHGFYTLYIVVFNTKYRHIRPICNSSGGLL